MDEWIGIIRGEAGWWDPDHGGKSSGVMRADLFDEGARTIARHGRDDKQLTTSQLRRFYDELNSLHQRIFAQSGDARGDEFYRALPLIKRVKAVASYAHNREKIPSHFWRFLEAGIDNVDDPDDLHAFVLVFEAVAGYAGGKEDRDE